MAGTRPLTTGAGQDVPAPVALPDAPLRDDHLRAGAELLPQAVRFCIWAPAQPHMLLALEGGPRLPMQARSGGWHEILVEGAGAGTLYRYALPDGTLIPDPASRFQPQDVHGPSEVIDPSAYAWTDGAWRGRPWEDAVISELHVGTFTPEGTYRAAIDRLDHLADLGVTAIELMPLADFPGQRNWGYDGVLLYAPDSSYGRPEDLKALIDAAHARGLMVFLDVVYNHFGPDGNYLSAYAPQFFTEKHKTPWGAAVNYDDTGSTEVRTFVIDNALYWIEAFHFDGLRLDAVHAILDESPCHILDALAARVRAAAGARQVHLILENENNEAKRLLRAPGGVPLHYTAQWNDDLHHVLHVAATGEKTGYYAEYDGDTYKLGRALAEGFAFQGEMMIYRGETRGEPSTALPPTAFVGFIQNHDQIGNRAFGERIDALARPQAIQALAAVYLLLPQIPMLFMGEEWAASQPFLFFCDFDDALAEAVRSGRRAEFARFPEFQSEEKRQQIPDPQAATTFAASKLDWSEREAPKGAERLQLYKSLLALRQQAIRPLLPEITAAGHHREFGPGAIEVTWSAGQSGTLILVANLSDAEVPDGPPPRGELLWQQGAIEGALFKPWSVRWSIERTP